jgi:hypothetical protein
MLHRARAKPDGGRLGAEMRSPPWTAAIIALALATTAFGSGAGDYVGAAVCGACHRSQYERQSRSAHAHSLSKTSEHALASQFVAPEPLYRPPRYRFDFSARDGLLAVTVSGGPERVELPIEWAFGAGRQAVTFVSRRDENWYLEHYFSWYRQTGALGATPGHAALRSNTLQSAVGHLYNSQDAVTGISACFRCHSTGPPQVGDGNSITPLESSVRCEACHGPGRKHALDPAAAIGNPARMNAAEINRLCGECHRPAGGPEANTSRAWNVRLQPAYLAQSSCFRKGDGGLSCVTCHDPHSDADRDPAHYDRRCVRCHAGIESLHGTSLKVAAAADCVTCHMPRVSPQPNLHFTNHRIGVYDPSDPLRPQSPSGRLRDR